MKHNKKHDNSRSAEPPLMPVTFEFVHPTATTVCVAGTFNDWQAEAKPMLHFGDGRWHKETVLAPGTYEYCLVVNGQWIADPLAKESVPNPFGGRNSLLKVASSPQASHLADAEHLPLKTTNQSKEPMERTNRKNRTL
jgi:1,4-alpha-glucan branching enzyme